MESNASYVASINENAARYLYRSANWTLFFAVLGYIMAAVLIIVCFALLLGGGIMSRMSPAMAQMPFSFVWIGIIYLPISAIYIWASTLMLGFASKAKQALKTNDDDLIEQSFKNMNKFLAVMGIMTIVVISLYLILIVVAIIASATGMMA